MIRILKTILALSLVYTPAFAMETDWQGQALSDDQMAMGMHRQLEKIDAIAIKVAAQHTHRDLVIVQRQLEREAADAEMKLNAIRTMAEKRGDLYSISLETLFEKGDFLLYGCVLVRAANLIDGVDVSALQVTPETSADVVKKSLKCSVSDIVTFVVAGAAPAMFSTKAKEVVRATIGKPINGKTYPKTVKVLRTGAAVALVFYVASVAYSWNNADELAYRGSIEKMSSDEIANEMQAQWQVANDARLQLAGTQRAITTLEQSMK